MPTEFQAIPSSSFEPIPKTIDEAMNRIAKMAKKHLKEWGFLEYGNELTKNIQPKDILTKYHLILTLKYTHLKTPEEKIAFRTAKAAGDALMKDILDSD
jgi:hypothetical protein